MDSSLSTLASIFDLATARRTELHTSPTVPHISNIQSALASLPKSLPKSGLGTEEAVKYVQEQITQGLPLGHAGPRYFGFVTGGVLPAAEAGDFLSTIYDLNCMNNLAEQSITASVENCTLEMLLDLFELPRDKFTVRTLTSGATSSNVLGLACGRDYAVQTALGDQNHSVAEDGFSGVTVHVLCDRPHASTVKAAALVGIGRSNVFDLGAPDGRGIDLDLLEKKLAEYAASFEKERKTAFVVLSYGEVNTGEFTPNVAAVRELCDKYDVWLHIDGAFGAFARLVPELSFMAKHLELADSITADAHKWLNVPYDSGIFYSRSLALQKSIFGPSSRAPPPAYLAPAASSADLTPELEFAHAIPSALVLGIENSRRFKALPLFCTLIAMGKQGYAELVARNVAFARRVGEWMHTGPGAKWYEVLNADTGAVKGKVDLNVVLFRAREGCGVQAFEGPGGGAKLMGAINETRKMYVSPGVGGAVRLAVSNWMTGLDKREGEGKGDFEIVVEVLEGVMAGRE